VAVTCLVPRSSATRALRRLGVRIVTVDLPVPDPALAEIVSGHKVVYPGAGARTALQRGEEVAPLVVDDDHGREALDVDGPDRLHAELGLLEDLGFVDVVPGEDDGRSADRCQVDGCDEDAARPRAKARWYLEAGVEIVWLLLPESREVLVATPPREWRVGRGPSLPATPSLPGLAPAVNELFFQLDGAR
jgi:hypothetical protein